MFLSPLFRSLIAFGIGTGWLVVSSVAQADDAFTWKIGPVSAGKVEMTCGADVIEIAFPRDNIVNFDFRPGGQSGPHSPVLAGFNGNVIPTEAPGANGTTVLSTPGMSVAITTARLNIKISDPKGKLLCELPYLTGGGVIVKHDPASVLGDLNDVWAGYQGVNGGPFVWTTTGFGLLWDSDGGEVMTGDARGPNDSQLDINRNPGTNSARKPYPILGLVPKKVATLPVDQQATMVKAYQKSMGDLIQWIDLLTQDIQSSQWDDARKVMAAIKQQMTYGHKDFRLKN